MVVNLDDYNKDKIMANVSKTDDKIRATGWGSKVRAVFDDKTGELTEMVRETGGEDAQAAASYCCTHGSDAALQSSCQRSDIRCGTN